MRFDVEEQISYWAGLSQIVHAGTTYSTLLQDVSDMVDGHTRSTEPFN